MAKDDQNKNDNKDGAKAAVEFALTGMLANMSMKMCDDFVDKNASVASKAGLVAILIRETHGTPCEFCAELAGRYDYENRPSGVRSRHKGCQCTIDFKTERRGAGLESWKKYDKAGRAERIEKSQNVDFYAGTRYTQVVPAKYADWIGDNKYYQLMKNAPGEEAKKYIRTAYRKSSIIGDGGTVAIRKFEKATGLNCGRNGHNHSMKAEQLVNLINNSLKKDSLSISEKEYLNKELRALEKVI